MTISLYQYTSNLQLYKLYDYIFAFKFIFFSKECLLIGFYTKMDLYNQPTWPNTLKLDIKQNWHYKNNHWLTWYEVTKKSDWFSAIQAQSTILNFLGITRAVYGITHH